MRQQSHLQEESTREFADVYSTNPSNEPAGGDKNFGEAILNNRQLLN